MPTGEGRRVAIVGRPNVGKSTLFNVLTGTRRSVVQDRPGVTRDLLFAQCSVWEKEFEIVDTGGVTDAADEISQAIKIKVRSILKEVDLVLIVTDGRDGITDEDRSLVHIVQTSGLEALVVVNKIDRVEDEDQLTADFYEFGLDVVPASIEQRRGVSDLMEWLHPRLSLDEAPEVQAFTKIAIVGKPNVGKSSLFNRLAKEDRVIVSSIAGTTVDSVDVNLKINDQDFTIIDTAGLRRQARRIDDLETISAIMSEKSIKRADLILLMVDALEGPTDQDARILQGIFEEHKGVILVANKSDLGKEVGDGFRKKFREKCEKVFHFFPEIWIQFISAKTGSGLKDLFEKIATYQDKLSIRIKTRELNDFFVKVIRQAPAPMFGSRTVKFYYLTQTRQLPPSFIAFANHPKGIDRPYRRFLINRIRERWDLAGVPIRIFIMKRGQKL